MVGVGGGVKSRRDEGIVVVVDKRFPCFFVVSVF